MGPYVQDKAEKDASLHAGPRRLPLGTVTVTCRYLPSFLNNTCPVKNQMLLFLPGSLQKLMEARIDAHFEENYQHLVDKDSRCNLSHCSAD